MQIEFLENRVSEMVIESPILLRKYIQELYKQSMGEDGKFILSEEDKILNISKNIEIVLSPLEVDVNEKKYYNKMMSQLKEIAYNEEHYLETHQLYGDIAKYFFGLESDMEVPLVFEQEADFMQLAKAFAIKVENSPDNYAQELIEYGKIVSCIGGKRILILVNAGAYIDVDEMNEIAKQMSYMKLHLFLIESQSSNYDIGQKRYIIDTDRCEIY